MKTKSIIYLIIGFLIQLFIIGNLAYWYTLLNDHSAEEATRLYATNFPATLQDKTVLMLMAGVLAIISMLFCGAARKSSSDRSVRNIATGLIFFDAIILLLLAIALF